MASSSEPVPARAGKTTGADRLTALVLASLGAVLLWAYWTTLAELVNRWSTDAPYSHSFLVPAFALLFLGLRRHRLTSEGERRFRWWGLVWLAAGLLVRLVGAYLYFDWLDAFSLVPSLAGLLILVGGKKAWQAGWPAIAFLVFMIPLPFRLERAFAAPLQSFTTQASTYCLQTLGLPALAEGNTIVLEDFKIGVVEACSGLSMLVFFFALATAVAYVIPRPLWEKAALVAGALPIAIIANMARITATGVLHEIAGSRAADLFFHELAGWLMLPLALGLLWLQLQLQARLFLKPEAAAPLFLARPGDQTRPPSPGPEEGRNRAGQPPSRSAAFPFSPLAK